MASEVAAVSIRSLRPSEAMRNHPQTTQISWGTLEMLQGLLGATQPSPQQMVAWAQAIAEGRIDIHATVELSRKSMPSQPEYKAVWIALLNFGRWGAQELYPRMLDRVDGLEKGAEDNNHFRVTWSQNPDFIRVYLLHPRVDVNERLMDEDYTLLDECLAVLDKENKPQEDSWSKEEAYDYAQLLFDRGAVLKPAQVKSWLSDSASHSHLAVAAPLIAQAQQEWQDFCAGTLKPDQLTRAQLGHFYSLGHLPEVLHKEHWQGQEMHVLALYEQLPEWVKAHQPCLLERQVLQTSLFPQSVVESWSIQSVLAPPQVAR